jgi:hypothetical protein
MYNVYVHGRPRVLEVGRALARENMGKNSTSRQLHLYGEPRPAADHYELWPTWWPTDLMSSKKILHSSFKGFSFCEMVKMAISYTL